MEWKPIPRQADFAALPMTIFEALYGGAAGGGKSDLLLMLPLLYKHYQVQGYKAAIFRRTYPELAKELILRSKVPYSAAGGVYNEQKKSWSWPEFNSHIQFCYAEHEQDVRRFDTVEWNLLMFDEATSFTEFMYKYLALSRVRSNNPSIPPMVRSATNPGNVGHGFFRDRFVAPAKDGYTIIREAGLQRIFIPAKATDNPHVDKGYVLRLAQLPEAERLAKLDGDWWTFSGQVFRDWRLAPYKDEPANAQHVVSPFDVPDWWPVVLAIDWGFAAGTWAGWFAISPSTRIYLFQEYYQKEKKIAEWAADIARMSRGRRLVDVVIDPSAYGRRGDEYTIAQQFERISGLSCRPADNDRIGGKELLQEVLRWQPRPAKFMPADNYSQETYDLIYRRQSAAAAKEYKAQFIPEPDEYSLPRLQVFDTCEAVCRTIPLCVFDVKNPEDVAEFVGDDPYDGLRYGIKAAMHYVATGTATLTKVGQICSDYEQTGDATTFYRRMEQVDGQQRPQHYFRGRFARSRHLRRRFV